MTRLVVGVILIIVIKLIDPVGIGEGLPINLTINLGKATAPSGEPVTLDQDAYVQLESSQKVAVATNTPEESISTSTASISDGVKSAATSGNSNSANSTLRVLVPARGDIIEIAGSDMAPGNWLIEARGKATYDTDRRNGNWHGPDGLSGRRERCGCSIGELGGTYRGKAFCVGSRYEIALEGEDTLYLWFADNDFSDNDGYYEVSLTRIDQ